MSAWCRTKSPGALVGEIVKTVRGDGYALYMVFTQKPLSLIHIQLGDAYRADAIWERGIKLSDVREPVCFNKARKAAKLFKQ